ncbi:hypothetical protein [Bradyrhizobium sp.]|uniref:hypothetical protein n=1 Tax=Bradyrhizobium sp. TaxID=376 RepID=UPI00261BCC30|nr:hypothetical protein [Bradyrhizobium sp.]
MNSIVLNYWRPVSLRWLVVAGLIPALVLALVVAVWSTEAKKECRGGAFSNGFSAAFDVRKCDLVLEVEGQEITQIPLPR